MAARRHDDEQPRQSREDDNRPFAPAARNLMGHQQAMTASFLAPAHPIQSSMTHGHPRIAQATPTVTPTASPANIPTSMTASNYQVQRPLPMLVQPTFPATMNASEFRVQNNFEVQGAQSGTQMNNRFASSIQAGLAPIAERGNVFEAQRAQSTAAQMNNDPTRSVQAGLNPTQDTHNVFETQGARSATTHSNNRAAQSVQARLTPAGGRTLLEPQVLQSAAIDAINRLAHAVQAGLAPIHESHYVSGTQAARFTDIHANNRSTVEGGRHILEAQLAQPTATHANNRFAQSIQAGLATAEGSHDILQAQVVQPTVTSVINRPAQQSVQAGRVPPEGDCEVPAQPRGPFPIMYATSSAGSRFPFRPSMMLDPVARARRDNPSPAEAARRIAAGVSPNYRGDYTLERNRPANIPEEENCSLWITDLPPDVTTHELLGSIRYTGRVWASVIHPPTGAHNTAAAKVTFFTALAARTLYDRANGPGGPGLVVRGFRARVRRDRNAVAEADAPSDHTRVLSIAGPIDIINEHRLRAYFSRSFVFETDQVVWMVRGQCINSLEWHFGSYRCQAQWAYRNLTTDPEFASRGIWVRFERDPCDW